MNRSNNHNKLNPVNTINKLSLKKILKTESKKLISLLIIFLIITVPFNIYFVGAADGQTSNNLNNNNNNNGGTFGLESNTDIQDISLDSLPSPDQACEIAGKETSKFIGFLDNGLISSLEKLSALAHLICVVMNTIDQVMNLIAEIIGMFQGMCCKTGLTSPGGSACAKMDILYMKFKIAWPPVMKTLCCMVSCGWCTGQGCGKIAGIDFSKIGSVTPLAMVGPTREGASKGIGQFSISPYENIYVAAGCLCPTAVLFNLRKLKTIYQTYSCCIEQACKNGQPIDECGHFLNSATCMYWEGAVYKSLVKVVMSFIAKYISKFIPEFLLESKLLNCALVLLDLWQAKDILEGVKSAFGWLTETFDDPKCESLNTDEQGMKDELKDVRADSYQLLMQGNEGKKIDGILGVAEGTTNMDASNSKTYLSPDYVTTERRSVIYIAYATDPNGLAKSDGTATGFIKWYQGYDKQQLTELENKFQAKYNELLNTMDESSAEKQALATLVTEKNALNFYIGAQAAIEKVGGDVNGPIYQTKDGYLVPASSLSAIFETSAKDITLQKQELIDMVIELNGFKDKFEKSDSLESQLAYSLLINPLMQQADPKIQQITKNIELIESNMNEITEKYNSGLIGQSELNELSELKKEIDSYRKEISASTNNLKQLADIAKATEEITKVSEDDFQLIEEKFTALTDKLPPATGDFFKEVVLSQYEIGGGYDYSEARKAEQSGTLQQYYAGVVSNALEAIPDNSENAEVRASMGKDIMDELVATDSQIKEKEAVFKAKGEEEIKQLNPIDNIDKIELSTGRIADTVSKMKDVPKEISYFAENGKLYVYYPGKDEKGNTVFIKSEADKDGNPIKGTEEVLPDDPDSYNAYTIGKRVAILKQAQYEAAFQLLYQTLGRFANNYIDKMCEDRWDSSESEEDSTVSASTLAGTHISNQELESRTGICSTINGQSINVQSTRAEIGSGYEYIYSYNLVSCNGQMNYYVFLKNGAFEKGITDGIAKVGESVSKRAGLTDPGIYSEVCIRYSLQGSSDQECFPIA